MSIRTEIERLTIARAAISAAIADKGVDVPEGTKLDGMAALIESIEGGGGKPIYELYSYTSSSQPIDDGDGNWRVKFLESGTLTVLEDMYVDIFAVGGGGNGGWGAVATNVSGGPGGGGGGYTNTVRNLKLETGKTYVVTVGGSNGTSSLAVKSGATLCSAAGGSNGGNYSSGDAGKGGNGGSGGGPGSYANWVTGYPGSDGANGTNNKMNSSISSTMAGGIGQGTTTREFGEPNGDLYSGGGGGGQAYSGNGVSRPGAEGGGGDGGSRTSRATAGGVNTGGGGGGGGCYSGYTDPGTGGSGIVIIRNVRMTAG